MFGVYEPQAERLMNNSSPNLRAHAKLHSLVAATHTPFSRDGTLRLDIVEQQAAHLQANGVGTVFIGGTTGESASLTLEERLQLTERWVKVTHGTSMRVVVHVGSNCLADARALAAQAQRLGATAIAALAPSYFKPATVEVLASCCAEIAAAAPETPFYYYDIPALTGVNLPMPEFLDRAATAIRSFAGVKFTNPDLIAYQRCLEKTDLDVPWGIDECLLPALALGAKGAVGSTYNFAAPIYHRLIAAFQRGDLETAQKEQLRSVTLVKTLAARGYMGSAKAVMEMLGIEVGPARLPNGSFTPELVTALRRELEAIGFFAWLRG